MLRHDDQRHATFLVVQANFEHETSGAKVTTEQFLVLLSNIRSFQLRAAPNSSPTRIRYQCFPLGASARIIFFLEHCEAILT